MYHTYLFYCQWTFVALSVWAILSNSKMNINISFGEHIQAFLTHGFWNCWINILFCNSLHVNPHRAVLFYYCFIVFNSMMFYMVFLCWPLSHMAETSSCSLQPILPLFYGHSPSTFLMRHKTAQNKGYIFQPHLQLDADITRFWTIRCR